MPTHMEVHDNVQRDFRLLARFRGVAARSRLPHRGHCGVCHSARLYGQRDGETYLERVGPPAVAPILGTVGDGFNARCCLPGCMDAERVSSCPRKRQPKLGTPGDADLAALLDEQGVQFVILREVPQL